MIYQDIITKQAGGRKTLAILIDPDKVSLNETSKITDYANQANVDFIMIGGSLINDFIESTIEVIKQHTNIPVIIFPGSILQISGKADAILLLSLISGRNSEYLIGNHVYAAPILRKSGIEVISTGYILIGNDSSTSVAYMSGTCPIPGDKTDIIIATAIAGEMLGHKMIYLEAGSGSGRVVNEQVIREVKDNIQVPLITGGGIKTGKQAKKVFEAGADMIVIGNAIEQDPEIILSVCEARDHFK
ncbi:MAG: geranylgeranylglyceryl/heptaprenylglyceryl phosphate synthase [Bacteroidota bacterium]